MPFEIRSTWRPIAAVLAGLSVLASAGAQSALHCEVAMDFRLDGKLMAAPSAIVEFGQEAEVTIGNPDEHAWRFVIVADAPTTVRRANVIPVSVDLYEIGEGKTFLRASPHFNAVPGQRADIETIFGDGRHAHLALVANVSSAADVDAPDKSDDGEPR
jgi:hypothetical protein